MKYKYVKTKALTEIFLIVTLSIVMGIAFNAEPVQAQQEACCEITNTGQFCQYTDETNCAAEGRKALTTCDRASFCRPGCCNLNSENEGCFKNTGKAACDALGGQYSPDAECGIPECQKGCCVLGSNCQYGTETSCNNLYTTYAPDLSVDFRAAGSEIECLGTCINQQTGCCISEDGCQRTTGDECDLVGGEFSNRLCSEQDSGVCDACKGEKTTGCIEGDTDIYSFDSCGNQERVSKTCDFADGKLCGQNAANNECDDANCAGGLWDNPAVDENQDGNYENDADIFRKNGESWCEYDADAGPTVDLPGSRHFRHACINGKEVVEECKDYRDEICFQGRLHETNDQNSPYINSARCIKNRFEDCPSCETENCCTNSDLRDCVWVGIDTQNQEDLENSRDGLCGEVDAEGNPKKNCQSSDDTEGYCVPALPPGGQFWKGDGGGLCNVATTREGGTFEPVVAHWDKLTEWDCENNCMAYTPEFAYTQNGLCIAYGDCGAHYNLAGKWTNDGFERPCDKGDNDHDLLGGDVADDYTKEKLTRYNDGDEKGEQLLDECLPRLDDPNNFEQEWSLYQGVLDFGDLYPQDFGTSSEAYAIGASVVVGVVVYAFLITAALIWGTAASVGLTAALTLSAFGPYGWIAAAAVLVVTAISIIIISIAGQSYDATIETKCGTWQPPVGGDFCNLCHEAGERADGTEIDLTAGGLHECTEYLCRSLGGGCEYANTEEGGKCLSELCTGRNADVNSPQIRLSPKVKNQIKCVSASEDRPAISCTTQTTDRPRGAEVKWIKANSDFFVEFETINENGDADFATCRLDPELTPSYDQMSEGFNQAGLSSKHNLTFTATDLEAGEDYRYFIRCVDNCGNGDDQAPYELKFSVADAPDLTAPAFVAIQPENNALLKADANKTEILLTVNEKVLRTDNATDAGCRMSRGDVPYEQMDILMQCPAPARHSSQKCETIVDLTVGANTFFIKCKDRKGNVNQQHIISEPYTLVKTNALELVNVQCNGESCGSQTIFERNVTITAGTNAGTELGKATCGMSTADVGSASETDFFFLETQSTQHKMVLGPLSSRTYTYYVVCEDVAGNVEKEEISFTVDVDEEAPQIRKVFASGSNIIVETHEDATCKYVNEGNFDYDTANVFSVTGGKTHSQQSGGENFFLIGCRDRFENQMRLVTVHAPVLAGGQAAQRFTTPTEETSQEEESQEEPTTPQTTSRPPTTHNLDIQFFAFSNESITIQQGDTVTWTNQDALDHLVQSDNDAFVSERLGFGDSFSHTFSQKGTFDYHCSIHPEMLATIIVE